MGVGGYLAALPDDGRVKGEEAMDIQQQLVDLDGREPSRRHALCKLQQALDEELHVAGVGAALHTLAELFDEGLLR